MSIYKFGIMVAFVTDVYLKETFQAATFMSPVNYRPAKIKTVNSITKARDVGREDYWQSHN